MTKLFAKYCLKNILSCLQVSFTGGGAFHLPTRGPWVGTRGKKSIFSGREFVRGQFRQQGRVGSVARRRSVGEGWGLQTR